MLQLCCQNYLLALENVSITEETILVRVYLVVTILKLKPNNRFNPESYRGIWVHVVILLQNSRPLLTLPPSDLAAIKAIIRIVWLRSNLS